MITLDYYLDYDQGHLLSVVLSNSNNIITNLIPTTSKKMPSMKLKSYITWSGCATIIGNNCNGHDNFVTFSLISLSLKSIQICAKFWFVDAKFWRIQLTKESKSNLLGATMLLI